MDELKIKSDLMRGMVSKILESIIRKKVGYKVNLDLNDLSVVVTDNKCFISLDADIEMSIDEFQKVTRVMDSRD